MLNSASPQLTLFPELLENGYDLKVRVTGTSMMPFLKTESVVTLSRIPVSDLHIGDIIFCRCQDGSFRLHRLIRILPDELITKGDALRLPDPPFRKTDFLARVTTAGQIRFCGVKLNDMDSVLARTVNLLIARYQSVKIFMISIYRYLRLSISRFGALPKSQS